MSVETQVARLWWRMQRNERGRIAETVSGRELVGLLDFILANHRGDKAMCVCLMPEHGHDIRCPARSITT